MTTKRKIIVSFSAMMIIMIILAGVGYFNIGKAGEYFTEYDRLAKLNTALSDINTNLYQSAYNIERFVDSKSAQFIDAAESSLQKGIEIGTNSLQYFVSATNRAEMEKTLTLLTNEVAVLQSFRKNVYALNDHYNKVVMPLMKKQESTTTDLALGATLNNNIPMQDQLNKLWPLLLTLDKIVVGTAEADSRKQADETLASIKKIADTLASTAPGQVGKASAAAYSAAFGELETALAKNRQFADEMARNMEHTYATFRSAIDLNYRLNNIIDKQMMEYSVSVHEVNTSANIQIITISVVGIILGCALTFLITLGIIRVLGRVSAFASAVANGDFAYDPKVKEKGEIGNMISAMKSIPDIFTKIVALCRGGADRISSGDFRARLDQSQFNGDFKLLATAVNTVSESYTTVLDHLPMSVMTADTERHVRYLNQAAQKATGGNYVGEFCGSKLQAGVCKKDSDCLGKRCMASGGNIKGETSVDIGDHHSDLAMTVSPLYNLEGKLAGVLELVNDISQIKEQQNLMLQVAAEASDISDRVASASEELAAQVEQVSRGAEMQRERIESTASAMNEMNSTVMEVARNASQASEQSDGTRTNAESGAALVSQVVDAVNGVNKVAARLQENMETLGSKAESIGGVMNVISDIADQTNLLALNAAIEAARAGEAGRGFAVVADEVRKLAEKTMLATQEVGSNIKAIQQSTKDNIQEVAVAVESVQKATELANSSGSALGGIVELASSTSSVVASIATAAEEQSATSEEITRAIDEISQVVGETSEGMIQSSSAVQELSRMAQQLRSVMDRLGRE